MFVMQIVTLAFVIAYCLPGALGEVLFKVILTQPTIQVMDGFSPSKLRYTDLPLKRAVVELVLTCALLVQVVRRDLLKKQT